MVRHAGCVNPTLLMVEPHSNAQLGLLSHGASKYLLQLHPVLTVVLFGDSSWTEGPGNAVFKRGLYLFGRGLVDDAHRPDFDLVRPGLLVYGVVPTGRRRVDSTLANRVRPALSFKCRVSLVKEIGRGTSLSYGRTFVARRKMRVATLTAGYGDGYPLAASNRSKVLIGGHRCPVLGRVTMDQMMVGVSRVRNVRAGDEAVLIGRQEHDEITAGEVAVWCRTVPWEVLTAISYRVPRIYRGGQAA